MRKAAGNNDDITFDEYVALLLDQASVEDVAAGYKKNPRTRVNVHEAYLEEDSGYDGVTHEGNVHEVNKHDMDALVTELLACQALQRPPR